MFNIVLYVLKKTILYVSILVKYRNKMIVFFIDKIIVYFTQR
ncbi:hypothetical protein KCO_03837 [Pectobacterium brasiliense ICMP 19477]|nr:hypothetical protein KCO_03837 [Pectobacterium brasiliense ICMP 19477]